MFARLPANAATPSKGFAGLVATRGLRQRLPIGRYSSKITFDMANASTVSVDSKDSGVLGLRSSADSSFRASQVLQEDMEKHNIFFNDSGFHNHIVHHVLSIYGIGASPEAIQRAYDNNATYQRPALTPDDAVVASLRNKEEFQARCGKRNQYANFLAFFQREISEKGIASVVNEYIFARDEFADDMLIRLYGGLLHPIIHLGFGLEFNQPAVVAQALAQAAVHEARLADYLLSAEKAAGGIGKPGNKTLVQIQDEMREDTKLRGSVLWEDANKIFDGVMKRAPDEMIRYASQYSVGHGQVDQKLVEMINAVVHYTGGAQNPSKKIKFDFFYMHCLNSAIFFPTFLAQPWVSVENKVRLLEWKGRMDLVVYASRGCVEPRSDDIKSYNPSKSWEDVFALVGNHGGDDGHATKFIRLLAYGEKACKPFEGQDGFPVTGDMWIKLANMVVDSISGPEGMWVRSAGFPEAWADIPARPHL